MAANAKALTSEAIIKIRIIMSGSPWYSVEAKRAAPVAGTQGGGAQNISPCAGPWTGSTCLERPSNEFSLADQRCVFVLGFERLARRIARAAGIRGVWAVKEY